MPITERLTLEVPSGNRSATVALFMAQLDDQHALLKRDLDGIQSDELEWQPGRGTNTIGMLLAHLAVVEVFWTQVGPERRSVFLTEETLGIGMDDDGMPIAPDGAPPANLAGKSFDFYQSLLDRARAYARRAAAMLTDEDLAPSFVRTRRNGDVQELTVRWVLYHMLEHFSGHYGQILLLRHLYRDAHRPKTS
jgi:uncharacterized damage-inducible protein DinB